MWRLIIVRQPPTHFRPILHQPPIRAFTSGSSNSFQQQLAKLKQLPPRRIILDSEIEENFLRGTGPGGQKINKTSSAVQLKHLPTGVVVKCQATRSRAQNRKLARKLLGERLEELELGADARTQIKGRERSKKKASGEKKRRRKYRALEEAKEQNGLGAEQDLTLEDGVAEEEIVKETERPK